MVQQSPLPIHSPSIFFIHGEYSNTIFCVLIPKHFFISFTTQNKFYIYSGWFFVCTADVRRTCPSITIWQQNIHFIRDKPIFYFGWNFFSSFLLLLKYRHIFPWVGLYFIYWLHSISLPFTFFGIFYVCLCASDRHNAYKKVTILLRFFKLCVSKCQNIDVIEMNKYITLL